ncbi:SRPBCC family protein [Micromonospora arborensis]|uniref:SRPBCC family protein n=1 Tax=Micromonospora arborensis TaxID=2116518 RepID=UPI0033EBB78B
MAESQTRAPVFEAQAEINIDATPAEVYAAVSDLPRSGEWSSECTGGEWIEGTPGTPGAVFRGHNVRGDDVVSWAPVVRGEWTTEAEVLTAVAGTEFSWGIRDSRGNTQPSVWSFGMSPENGGCRLVHRFRMDTPTEGIRKITADMDAGEHRQFLTDWGTKVAADLRDTLRRIKVVIEETR